MTFIALSCLTYGYQLIESSKSALTTFVRMPFSCLLQGVIFGRWLDFGQCCGVVLILCGCFIGLIGFQSKNKIKKI